jgi:hypothetical protein
MRSVHPLQSLHLILCTVGRLGSPRDRQAWLEANLAVCWLSCALRVPLVDAGDVPIDRAATLALFWELERACASLPIDNLARVVLHLAALERALPRALPAEGRVAKARPTRGEGRAVA